MAKADYKNYAVIGIGNFGAAVAKKLASFGNDVIVLDENEEKLNGIADVVSNVYLANNLSRSTLEEAGVGNCDVVIIGIGENIEASILTALNCIEMGVPRVVCKAGSVEHGKILKRLGAEVVFPEEDSGEKLAGNLMSRAILDMLPLSEDFSIASLDLSPRFADSSVVDLNFRRKYGINLVAVINGDVANASITPETILQKGSKVVISGTNEAIEKFRDANSQGLK